MDINLELSDPQNRFVQSTAKNPAFVAGFGSGKTQGLCIRTLLQAIKNPTCSVGYYAPTFDLLQTIAWPRFLALLEEWKLRGTLNKSAKDLRLSRGGHIIFRSLDTPERIIGYETCDSNIDELDTLKRDHAEAVWRAVTARNRQKKKNGAINTIAVATTPEGFKYVYEKWGNKPKPGYELIRAPTRSNLANLPPDYIESLMANYPPQLLLAYLEGEFVNMTSGSVYPDFSRIASHTDATITMVQNHGGQLIGFAEELHIGMDFNVGNCTGIVAVIRDNTPLILAEVTKQRDTPAMAEELKRLYPGHRINIYPDASGGHEHSSNASQSDLQVLQDAGFTVRAKSHNPRVTDRVASLNALILNAEGVRRLRVNTQACPTLTDCLEQQAYDKKTSAPDKSQGKDHAPDALGYFVHFLWPIVKPVATQETSLIHFGR